MAALAMLAAVQHQVLLLLPTVLLPTVPYRVPPLLLLLLPYVQGVSYATAATVAVAAAAHLGASCQLLGRSQHRWVNMWRQQPASGSIQQQPILSASSMSSPEHCCYESGAVQEWKLEKRPEPITAPDKNT
jgi:hypothetical protein